MPKIEKIKKLKTKKKATSLVAVKSKSNRNSNLTLTKSKEIKKLVSAYQQVGISLTKLLKPTK
jgi:hypothetical protein